jgi:glutaredoxin
MNKVIVTIYSRPGCHLCDDAKAVILECASVADFHLEEINIDQNPDLSKRYGFDIPVIHINGEEAFRHRVTQHDLQKKLRLASRR